MARTGDEVKPEINTDQAEAAAAAPKVSGISKLVEALSKRAEKEGPAEKTDLKVIRKLVICSSMLQSIFK